MSRPQLTTALLLSLLAAAPARAANPLAPLARFQAQLIKGMNAVIKGADPAKAFAPLAAVAKRPIGPDLTAAGATSASIIAMEVELAYYDGATPVYYLRTAVTTTRRGPAFVGFSGRAITDGKLYVKAHPFAHYKGTAAALGAAGSALARAVAGKGCAALPLAAANDFAYLPPGKMADRATRDLERMRTGMAAECAKLAALKSTKVELRIDDVAFAVLGADGKMKGMIKTDLELDGGKLVLEISRFRPPR
jgi:hypothetical protein